MQAEADEGRARTPPRFSTALIAGAASGVSVDLLFYPIDTIKTRLQSAEGFWKAGGVAGVYRGMGSVAVGSAPGASIFFVTYETLKVQLSRILYPDEPDKAAKHSSSVHMAAASAAEVVRLAPNPGSMPDSRPDRGGQVTAADGRVRRVVVGCGVPPCAGGGRRTWPVPRVWRHDPA